MAKIMIIGAGVMSCAFSVVCLENNHQTYIIGSDFDNELIDEIAKKNNFHPSLNTQLSDKTKFIKSKNLNENSLNDADLIVIGTNSKGMEWSAETLEKIFINKKLPPILLLTKGLNVINNKFELLIEKLSRLLSIKKIENINISAVAGPCLASELAAKSHSSVIITNKDIRVCEWLKNILSTHYYHISISDDVIGVEVSAAIKNIFSIAIGSAKELNNNSDKYLNTSAALFNQSVYEMQIFVSFLKGRKETVNGLAGIGDLHVSAAGGRNSLMGSFLGKGLLYSEVKNNQMKNITIEGAELSIEIFNLVKDNFTIKEIPLMFSIMESIVENKKIDIKWEYFV